MDMICAGKEYFFLDEAAKILDCKVMDLIHLGARSKLEIYVYLDLFEQDIHYYESGEKKVECIEDFYRVDHSDLEKYQFDSSAFDTVHSFVGPIRPGHVKSNYKWIHVGPISVDPEKFIIFRQDLISLSAINEKKDPDSIENLESERDDLKVRLEKSGRRILELEIECAELRKGPNPKALASLTKMVIAMAIGGYRYSPFDKKSLVPSKIQKAAERIGLSISTETIRGWLKDGAEMLPHDWNQSD